MNRKKSVNEKLIHVKLISIAEFMWGIMNGD